MKPFRRYIFFFIIIFSGFSAFSQSSYWDEVYSNVVYPFSTSSIESITKSSSGNIYAAVGKKVYKWDGAYWTELPNLNADYKVLSLTTDPAGNLYAAGFFHNSSGACYVAKWNGSSWSELGGLTSSPTGWINTIVSDASGNIYAAGTFRNSLASTYVAKFNGSTWSELGGIGSFFNNSIKTLAIDGAGNIYAGGFFTNGAGNKFVAKFNGSSWSELGGTNSQNFNSWIVSICSDPAGNIYCGGWFANASNNRYIAKFNGSVWSELGNFVGNGDISCIISDPTGNIYGAGNQNIGKWNGTAWTLVGSFNYPVYTMVLDGSGNIYAAGDFENGVGHKYVSKWTAASGVWAEINSGGNGILEGGNIKAIEKDVAGNIYVGKGGNVWKWDGNVWSGVGSGSNGLNGGGHIEDLAIDGLGNLYAACDFFYDFRRFVAKWNGSAWTELGTGPNALNANGAIFSLAVDAANNIYAAGYFTNPDGTRGVWKWNGTNWSQVGALGSIDPIKHISIDPAGNLYAHYTNNLGDEFIYKWSGTAWAVLPHTSPPVVNEFSGVMTFDNTGNVYAQHSSFLQQGYRSYVMKWNGSAWSVFAGANNNFNVGNGEQYSRDQAGNLYFAGVLNNLHHIDKWDGTNFSRSGPFLPTDQVQRHLLMLDGGIYAVGTFQRNGRTVGVLRYNANFLPTPSYINVSNKCTNDPNTKAKLMNPPVSGTVSAFVDGNPVTYSVSDSSFTYFTNGVTTTGNHQVSVRFTNSLNNSQKDSAFVVSPVVTPSVSITGNLVVLSGQSTSLSTVVVNGGPAPIYRWQDSTSLHSWATIVNATGSVLNYTPAVTGDKLRCIMTSNAPCASIAAVTSPAVQFMVNFPTGLNPVSTWLYNVKVFPNPVSSTLTIDSLKISDKWQSLAIYSQDGRTVYLNPDISGKTSLSVDIVHLVNGSYFMRLQRKNGEVAFFKLVKL